MTRLTARSVLIGSSVAVVVSIRACSTGLHSAALRRLLGSPRRRLLQPCALRLPRLRRRRVRQRRVADRRPARRAFGQARRRRSPSMRRLYRARGGERSRRAAPGAGAGQGRRSAARRPARRAGARPEQDVTRAQLAQAEVELAARRAPTSRATRRSSRSAASRAAQLDDSALRARVRAGAGARSCAANSTVAQLPSRTEQIQAQAAQVAAARAALEQATWKLDQKAVAATRAGRVYDTLYREGEWVRGRQPGRAHAAARQRQGALLRARRRSSARSRRDAQCRIHCDGCGADIPATHDASSPTKPSSRRRSSTATRRAASSCSWSRRGRRAETRARSCMPGPAGAA